MNALRVFGARLGGFFSARRRDTELNGENQTHLDLLAEENMRAGMSVDDARAAARREFGGVEQIKETYRDQRSLPFVETIAQDIRCARRTLRRRPGFVIAVVLSLSLGIGLNLSLIHI